MGLLGYSKWQKFRHALDRAIDSCSNQGRDPSRHFLPVVGKLDISTDRILTGAGKYSRGQPREDMIFADEHTENNRGVREMLLLRGVVPESLPAAEDTRKVEQRHRRAEKLIAKTAEELPAPAACEDPGVG